MISPYKDTSMIQGYLEFTTEAGQNIRVISEGIKWGVYAKTLADNGYIRIGILLKNKGDNPRKIWERFNTDGRDDR